MGYKTLAKLNRLNPSELWKITKTIKKYRHLPADQFIAQMKKEFPNWKARCTFCDAPFDTPEEYVDHLRTFNGMCKQLNANTV